MSATTFEALGTYVYLGSRESAALPAIERLAVGILEDVDRTCSRFRDDSDLSLANRHAGTWVDVDPILVAAVTAACGAARQTDGMVNPLLGRPLEQLGYDRDFGLLEARSEEFLVAPTPPSVSAWQDLGLDPEGALKVPAGSALDLGATGKAWAADLIAAAIAGEVGCGAVVSLGGDIAIVADDGAPWQIDIGTRPGDPPETTIGLDGGGLATSSTQVRRWARHGIALHHLLDPRTGLPAPAVWRTVTATGPSAVAANTATTMAVVLGDAALSWLTDHEVTARLVRADGAIETTGRWPADDASTDAPADLARRGA